MRELRPRETAARKSKQRVRTEHSQPEIYLYWPFGKHSKNFILEMPDKTLLLEEVNVLINGTVSSPHIDYYKHLDYVVKQAIAGDH